MRLLSLHDDCAAVGHGHCGTAGRYFGARSELRRPAHLAGRRGNEWSRPRTRILREAGNGPVVTRSSSTFGMSFADASGAESGIMDLRCTS